MESSPDAEKISQIISYLKNIDSRITRLETLLNLTGEYPEGDFKPPAILPENISDRADLLENQIGQFWFAKAGIILLSIGIIFLLTFPYQNLPPVFPGIIGFILTGVLFWLSRYLKDSFTFLSRYIFGGALLLLYFTTLRLHFFGLTPAITSILIESILLTAVSVVHLSISVKRQSVYLSSIGIVLGCITSLIINNSYSIILFSIALSSLIVYLKLKYDWKYFWVLGIIIVYLTNFVWIINNPLLGNNLALQNIPYISAVSLLIYAVIFSAGNFLSSKENSENANVIISTIANCFWCYSLFLLVTITKYKDSIAISHLITSLLFLTMAIVFWLKRDSKYSTFFYSLLGYTALSVAIISAFPKPDLFVWLCWQSLVVISTALWFRSKIIIVANFMMFLLIFFSYLLIAGTIGVVTLSFGFVALISARILNWQKHRLDLKTEAMRLFYLGTAFFIFPYALYHIVPNEYVSLSWTIVAIIYYLISVVLKNKKYRWMAILTFLLSILYILFAGSINLDPIYRIISFIVLGIVLLVISIFYGKVKSRIRNT